MPCFARIIFQLNYFFHCYGNTVFTFFETGLVPRFPTAILATGICVLAFLSLTAGLILDTVTRGRREAKRMHYLEIPSMLSILADRSSRND